MCLALRPHWGGGVWAGILCQRQPALLWQLWCANLDRCVLPHCLVAAPCPDLPGCAQFGVKGKALLEELRRSDTLNSFNVSASV